MNTKSFNIEVKKLDYLYENLPSSIAAVLVISLITSFALFNIVDNESLIIWLSLSIFLLLLRTSSFISYKKDLITLKNFSYYYRMFFLFSSLSALLWGSIAIFLMPTAIEYQTIILIFVSGLASGTALSLASKIEMFYTYLFLAIFPFVYAFTLADGNAYHLLTLTLFLYMIIVSSLAKKISNTINENIYVAFENKDLVTELEKKIQEANVAMDAKSTFLSVMSHEIRTPLNAIMGFVQILKKNETDPKKSKYLDTIDKSSKVLTNVINDILDLSKIESGKLLLETTSFQPHDEFESLYLLFKHNAEEKDIKLHNCISANLPKYLNSDILRLKQILSNLLSNAIKFTPAGKSIEFIINYDEKKSSLFFEVKDEGIGISKDNIENITQAFVQADSSTARNYGGTGLGLSIATTLLKLYNSELKIQSELGKGSSFSFEIELPAHKERQVIDEEVIADIDFKGKKILIAEDNKTNQMLIKLLLDDLGIESKIANNGLEATEMFEKESFDMVLMDINMPIKNGIEAMLDIHKYQNTKEKITPIIALTANAVSGDREEYLKEGFDEYLAKPIDTDKMMKVFTRFLS